ncbi:MAG: low-specificity L-threonine aldolase [Deltaproteobacteria bacterium]|jgi:threonine aldolase|nr:low-specificity L-threonine aldolase [Deltaproteobacteria bacterium]
MNKIIDLRSDTVTKPTPEMRSAMMSAEVGDDVYGEDPTVNRLESLAADMLGTEAAIYVSSGTQSNLLGIMSHCQRGDEYIVAQNAHTYRYEGGGAAVLGSIQPQPLDTAEDGTFDLGKVAENIKSDDFHFARTRLLCLENTTGGKVLPLTYIEEAAKLAKPRGLGFHLDGARIFNAAVSLKVDVQEISRHFDSISVCLSKGLGAPIGSVLCGTKELIDRARRQRKMLGGGMRQAGFIAAAGIYALENHINRLEEDHQNARALAEGLSLIKALSIKPDAAKTNMIFVPFGVEESNRLAAFLKEKGILISGRGALRLVTHLDISRQDIQTVIQAFESYF